ncbi:MAG: hypothetical protein JXR76_03580 [Deltaproteobacteria bacterium]|nr:hypothetical protein [Deltaproteobacteria bacterium]
MKSTVVSTSLLMASILLMTGHEVVAGDKPFATEVIDEHTNSSNIRDILIWHSAKGPAILVASEGGLVVYDGETGGVRQKITSRHGLFGNSLRKLQSSDDNTLTVAGDFGWATLCPAHNAMSFNVCDVAKQSPKSFDPVNDIVTLENSQWLVRYQSGLARRATETDAIPSAPFGMWNSAAVNDTLLAVGGSDGRFIVYQGTMDAPLTTMRFESPVLKITSWQQGFAVATVDGLFLYRNGMVTPLLNGNARVRATALFAKENTHLLIGTDTGDLLRFDGQKVMPLTRFNGERILAITADDSDIWLGVSHEGLWRLNRKGAVHVQVKSEICANHITGLTRHQGRLVVRTFDNGACYKTENGWKPLLENKSKYVHGLISNGDFLMAADSNGISLYNESFKRVSDDQFNQGKNGWLMDSAAISATLFSPEAFVIGSPFGMATMTWRENGFSTEFWSHSKKIPKHITTVAAKGERIFIGTEHRGVAVLSKEGEMLEQYLDPMHLPEAWVMALAPLSESELYVGTCQNGVAHIKNGQSTLLNAAKGLPDNRIIALAPYKNGVFVGGLEGLSYANSLGQITNIGNATSTPDPRTSALHIEDNMLYYGTEAGLAVYSLFKSPSTTRPE